MVITYVRNTDEASRVVDDIRRAGGKSAMVQVDAADAAAVVRSVEQVANDFGRIDILVNNAGFMDLSGTSFADIPLETVQQTIDVNIRAAFLYAQRVSAFMPDGGRIINIGSCLGKQIPAAGVTLYGMSKAAIGGLTRGLARELGARRILVNQISPGPIDTDMNPVDGISAEFQRSRTALGHYGLPSDIASAVYFLASSQSEYITGADIAVDGGTTA